MPKDSPDAAIVAYIKEAGKIAMEWTGDDKALSLALSPVWEKHFGELTENPSPGRAKRVTNERP